MSSSVKPTREGQLLPERSLAAADDHPLRTMTCTTQRRTMLTLVFLLDSSPSLSDSLPSSLDDPIEMISRSRGKTRGVADARDDLGTDSSVPSFPAPKLDKAASNPTRGFGTES